MAAPKDSAEEIARARLAYLSATGKSRLGNRSPETRAREIVTDQSFASDPPPGRARRGDAPVELEPPAFQLKGRAATSPNPAVSQTDVGASHDPSQSLLAGLKHRGLRISASHAATLVAVLLFAAVIAAVTLSQTSASTIPESTAPQVAVSSTNPSPSPVLIRVHVIGQVVEPGVVELEQGAIVADAIEAAGGLTSDADPAQLNLAAKLADGDQVSIGTTASPAGEVNGSSAGGNSDAQGLVNINTASAAELEELPGIGPVLAQAIVTWREDNGSFSDVSQLQEVSGIGQKVQEKLSGLVTV